MNTTTYEIRLSFRVAHGWGYEVAAIEEGKKGFGLGKWHATRDTAEQELDRLEALHEGSTLRAREQVGAD